MGKRGCPQRLRLRYRVTFLNVRHSCGTALRSVACVLGLIGSAHTASADAGRSAYAPCVVCHSPQGWGSVDGNIPSLAGQQKQYLEKQFAAFRFGVRVDTAMQLVAKHPAFKNHLQIAALAGYLSALDVNPRPVLGRGDHLRVGQETYIHICAACHGSDGAGESRNTVPRIAGQQYPYLRWQIEQAAELHRDAAPPEMASALRGMSDQEKDALADYVSRLTAANVQVDPTQGASPATP
jgi:cytochrome c553